MLRVDASVAFKVVQELVELGMNVEAQRVFEIAEPWASFPAHLPASSTMPGVSLDLLLSWVRAAVRLFEADEIVDSNRTVEL